MVLPWWEVSPLPTGIDIGVGCFASRTAGQGWNLDVLTPGTTDLWTWNVPSLAGKEPELVGDTHVAMTKKLAGRGDWEKQPA